MLPEHVQEIIKECTERNPSNSVAAASEAEFQIRNLPDFEQILVDLLKRAVQSLVYQQRRMENSTIRKETNKEAFVKATRASPSSPAIERIYRSCFHYYIAGTTLGNLMGEDLLKVAQDERSKADGHIFNARLCEELRSKVKDGQTVQEAVKEKDLRKMFQRLQRNEQGVA